MFTVFFVTIFILILLTSLPKPNTILNNGYNSSFLVFLLICSVTVNVVGREITSDTTQYVNWFLNMKSLSWETARVLYPTDLLFFSLQWSLSRFTDSSLIFLFSVWFIFLVCFLIFLKRIFLPWQLSLVLFTYFCFGFFYSYTTVALRQGIALVFILLALSEIHRNASVKRVILFSAVASLFHWSAVPFGLILILFCFKQPRLKTLISIWLCSSILYILGLQEKIMKPIRSYLPMIDDYTASSIYDRYTGGVNRIDFLLFSAFWIIASLLLYKFLNKEIKYLSIIKVYISFNIVFIYMGFVAFSDRIAGYSWMLIPVLIWYPIVNNVKYRMPLTLVTVTIVLGLGVILGKYQFLIPFYNVSSL